MSTSKVYLRPAYARENLHILTEAHASKVLIKGIVLFVPIYGNREFLTMSVAVVIKYIF